jgi:arylsulfatase A-like enzyme
MFKADNGGALLRGKGTLYEFGINVPLIVRWPRIVKPGSSTQELISGEDFAPTLLEAAGLAVPNDMTGRSFLKLLRGEAFRGRDYAFAQRSAHGPNLPRATNFDLGRCIVTRTHKLIYNVLWQMPYVPLDFAGQPFWKELQKMNEEGRLAPEFSRMYFSPTREMFELYDLRNDPAEFHNLAGRKKAAAVERKLRMQLSEWMIRERDYLPIPLPAEETVPTKPGN